tara:strand:+ start:95 stop:529 length:435 start_codon:yes stop_codon:yes gene_type:complete
MAFINPLTLGIGAKIATSIGKKYGPKVLDKLKDMTSKKNLTENLLILGVGASQVARLMVKPDPKGGGRAEEIETMRKEASKKFAARKNNNNNKIVDDPEKTFKEKESDTINIDGKEVKKSTLGLNRGGLTLATKYFKHKVNKDN